MSQLIRTTPIARAYEENGKKVWRQWCCGIVTFFEINITWRDSFVDVAHGLGEPRTLASLFFCLVYSFPLISHCVFKVLLLNIVYKMIEESYRNVYSSHYYCLKHLSNDMFEQKFILNHIKILLTIRPIYYCRKW